MEVSAFYSRNATDNPIIDDRLQKIIAIVAAAAPTRVLDIGCGRGTLIQALKVRLPGATFTGMEISSNLAEVARSRGTTVIEGDLARQLPFDDGDFDLVILGEVIEHLYDPDFTLDEIRRILRAEGRLIVSTPNLACWLNRLVFPFGIQPIFTETSTRRKYGRRFRVLGQWSPTVQGHIRVMTTDAFVELLCSCSYKVSSVIGCRFSDLDRNPVAKAIDSFFCHFPKLASGVIATAIKS